MLTQQCLKAFDSRIREGLLVRFALWSSISRRSEERRQRTVGDCLVGGRGFRDVGKRSPLRSCTVPYYIAPEGLIIPPAQQIDPDSVDETAYDDIEGLGREDEEAEGEKENKKKSVLPKQYANAVDMWACGCVYAELVLALQQIRILRKCREQLDQILCIFKLLERQTKRLGRM